MKISSTPGKIIFVLIAAVVIVGANVLVINQGIKAKINAPFKVDDDGDGVMTESSYYPGHYIERFGGTVSGMYYFSETGEKKMTSTMLVNEAHLGGFDYTVGPGDKATEVYINIKDNSGVKCFVAEEKTWPSIEFFYEGASDTVSIGNKILISYVALEDSNRIVSINDNRTRTQEIDLIKANIKDIVWTFILSMAGVDIALVLFFLNLFKLITWNECTEHNENKVVLIVLTVFFGVACLAMMTSKIIRSYLNEAAVETTQEVRLHDGE